jgi:hypothetical protein
VFDTRLAEDSQAKGRWMTSEGGSYYACGVGSALMGRGAHIFLIDDPFGSMAEACSEIERKAVHSWYQGTVYNRLEKGGAIVIVNHRMHHDDLEGPQSHMLSNPRHLLIMAAIMVAVMAAAIMLMR